MPITVRHEGNLGQTLGMAYLGSRGIEARKEAESERDRELRRELTYAGIRSQTAGRREALQAKLMGQGMAGEQQMVRDAMRFEAGLQGKEMELRAQEFQDAQKQLDMTNKLQFQHDLAVELNEKKLTQEEQARVNEINAKVKRVRESPDIRDEDKPGILRAYHSELLGIAHVADKAVGAEEDFNQRSFPITNTNGEETGLIGYRGDDGKFHIITPREERKVDPQKRGSDAQSVLGTLGGAKAPWHVQEAQAAITDSNLGRGQEPSPQQLWYVDNWRDDQRVEWNEDKNRANYSNSVKIRKEMLEEYHEKKGPVEKRIGELKGNEERTHVEDFELDTLNSQLKKLESPTRKDVYRYAAEVHGIDLEFRSTAKDIGPRPEDDSREMENWRARVTSPQGARPQQQQDVQPQQQQGVQQQGVQPQQQQGVQQQGDDHTDTNDMIEGIKAGLNDPDTAEQYKDYVRKKVSEFTPWKEGQGGEPIPDESKMTPGQFYDLNTEDGPEVYFFFNGVNFDPIPFPEDKIEDHEIPEHVSDEEKLRQTKADVGNELRSFGF